jgi:hypothetical protein
VGGDVRPASHTVRLPAISMGRYARSSPA